MEDFIELLRFLFLIFLIICASVLAMNYLADREISRIEKKSLASLVFLEHDKARLSQFKEETGVPYYDILNNEEVRAKFCASGKENDGKHN